MSDRILKVLFIDDEPKIIDGLRRQLRNLREKWEIRFAGGEVEALKMLEERTADVVVSDMRMPGMNGGQLLARIGELYPESMRIILSGQTEPGDLISEIGNIHHYLQKPCEKEMLCRVIDRTSNLHLLLADPSLRRLAGGVKVLAPAPQQLAALLHELARPSANVATVAAIVDSDPALAAKVMQLVNSAFFGTPQRASTPAAAVALLGLETIRRVLVEGRLFESCHTDVELSDEIAELWSYSVSVSEAAFSIAKQHGATVDIAGLARLAGLMSVVGRAVLWGSENVQEKSKADLQAAVGGYVLGLWGFAEEVVEAVTLHENPSQLPAQKTNDLVAYLHLARASVINLKYGDTRRVGVDADFLERRGFSSLLPTQIRKAA